VMYVKCHNIRNPRLNNYLQNGYIYSLSYSKEGL
jgi:hypothetical protein